MKLPLKSQGRSLTRRHMNLSRSLTIFRRMQSRSLIAEIMRTLMHELSGAPDSLLAPQCL